MTDLHSWKTAQTLARAAGYTLDCVDGLGWRVFRPDGEPVPASAYGRETLEPFSTYVPSTWRAALADLEVNPQFAPPPAPAPKAPSAARLLSRLNKAADKLDRVRTAAEQAVCDLAWAYVTAEVLAYSKAHPRRRVTYCSAMGTASLSVQKGGWIGRSDRVMDRDYQYGGHYTDKNPPAFILELERLAEETGLDWGMTGSRLLECLGGVVVRDLDHW